MGGEGFRAEARQRSRPFAAGGRCTTASPTGQTRSRPISARSSPASSRSLEGHWPKGLPGGVIHADLFPDNVFFLGDRSSGLIDFYFACNDALAYDVAVCLNAWCFEKDLCVQHHQGPRAAARLRGAAPADTCRARGDAPLARGAALRFLLTRAYDWLNTPPDALVSRKNPLEYVRRLRFHQGVRSIADYGLEETVR